MSRRSSANLKVVGQGQVYTVAEYVDQEKASQPRHMAHAKQVLYWQGMHAHIEAEKERRRKAREFEKYEEDDMA